MLDACFDASGRRVAAASADATARVYDASSGELAHVLEGHEGEISKVAFNPGGTGGDDGEQR